MCVLLMGACGSATADEGGSTDETPPSSIARMAAATGTAPTSPPQSVGEVTTALPAPAVTEPPTTAAEPAETVPITEAPTTAPPAPEPPTTQPVTTAPPTTRAALVSYANCDAVRAAGAAPIYQGDPGYSSKLDRDADGVACET